MLDVIELKHNISPKTSRQLVEHDGALVHKARLIFLNDEFPPSQVAMPAFRRGPRRYAPSFGELAKGHREHRAGLRNLFAVDFERHGRGNNHIRAVVGDVVRLTS
jgi:hypothetical protein